MKPFTPFRVSEGHRQCHPSLDRLDFMSETVNLGYTFFQTKSIKCVFIEYATNAAQ